MTRAATSSLIGSILALTVGLAVSGCGSDTSTNDAGKLDRTAPPAILGLQVDRIRDGEVWLSWQAVSDDRQGEVAYVVFRAVGDSAAVRVDTTYRTSFQDLGLEYATVYTYYVIAVDAAGNEGPPSASVSGQPFNNLAPRAPTGLRVYAHNLALYARQTVELTLDWDANTESDLSGYRVYRTESPGGAADQATLRAETAAPRFEDEQVAVGQRYYYRVTAVDRGGKESPASREVGDVALPAVTLLEPIQGALAAERPVFRWRPVEGAVSYRVVVTTSPASGEVSDMPPTGDTTAVFRGRAAGASGSDERYALQSGQVYFWKVVASTRADGRENSVSLVESFKVR